MTRAPEPLEATVPRRRIDALDALRFLAALAVMLAHIRVIDPVQQHSPTLNAGPLNSHSAVMLFFVLSGLVLHLSMAGEWPGARSAGRFFLRRWFRIYPLYYVAVVLALVTVWCLPLGQCPWLLANPAAASSIGADHTNARQWLHHALLVTPGLEPGFILPPIWTLAEEARVALIFPWLSLAVQRCPRGMCAGITALLFAAGPWLMSVTCSTVGLISLFMIGAWVAEHHAHLRLSSNRAVLVTAAGLILYSIAPHLHWRLHQPMAGAGAALMMLGILRHEGLRSVLGHRWLTLGGRSSYGLYILHFPLINGIAWLVWSQAWPPWLLYMAGFPLCLTAAIMLHFAVEAPIIRLGRRLIGSGGRVSG